MTPAQIIAAIAFATGASVGATGAWQWQASRIASAKLELKNEQLDRANERIAIQRAARASIERATSAVSQAQTDAATRAVGLAADRDRARSELERLRSASEAAVRNANSGIAACTSAVRTYNVIFSQCAGQLSEVAGDADKWSSHALMFQGAWPR